MGVVLYVIWTLLKWVVEMSMGRGRERRREEEIEMRDEEHGLIGGMVDGESDGLPAYEEAMMTRPKEACTEF